MNDFSQNASAFNCSLITFKSLVWIECHLCSFHATTGSGDSKIRLTEEDWILIKKI